MSENDRGLNIIYAVEKGFNLQSKVQTLKKFAATLRAAKLLLILFSNASCGTTWPLHSKSASYAYASGK